jgi:hypothetical protein
MFYFEDTTRTAEAENDDDRLIILDGTVDLDGLAESALSDVDRSDGVVARLKRLFA